MACGMDSGGQNLFTPRASRIQRPTAATDLSGISWAIVGGESGPNARIMNPNWARELRDVCVDQNVAFFFKQWGGVRPKSGGRLLDGATWDGFPVVKLGEGSGMHQEIHL